MRSAFVYVPVLIRARAIIVCLYGCKLHISGYVVCVCACACVCVWCVCVCVRTHAAFVLYASSMNSL